MKRSQLTGWLAAAGIAMTVASLPAAFAQVQQPPQAQQPRQVQPGRMVQQFRGAPRVIQRPVNMSRDDEATFDGVFLPPDRTAKRRLELAQQMLDERRYGEGVRLLGALLESSEDFFFKPNPEQPVFRSLKAEAGRLVAGLPAEGQESYELQFGARARQMLKQATSAGSLADVAEVSRRFFYTEAGQEATFLLARNHLDQNRPLAAALCLERLGEVPTAPRAFGTGAVADVGHLLDSARASPTKRSRRSSI